MPAPGTVGRFGSGCLGAKGRAGRALPKLCALLSPAGSPAEPSLLVSTRDRLRALERFLRDPRGEEQSRADAELGRRLDEIEARRRTEEGTNVTAAE